jgi:hypothetical protein
MVAVTGRQIISVLSSEATGKLLTVPLDAVLRRLGQAACHAGLIPTRKPWK